MFSEFLIDAEDFSCCRCLSFFRQKILLVMLYYR